MFGLSGLELVALGVVGLGVCSVLAFFAFKVFEKALEPKRWHAKELDQGPRPSFEERELMGSGRGSFGDRLTAMERKLPALKKPLDEDAVDKFLARFPDVDGLPSASAAPEQLPPSATSPAAATATEPAAAIPAETASSPVDEPSEEEE